MQGVKGTHSPGQHGTLVNRRPRTVKAGGVVRFEHRDYQSERLLPYVGQEVIVHDVDDGDSVKVLGCVQRVYYRKNGRRSVQRSAYPWLADAARVEAQAFTRPAPRYSRTI